MKRVLLVVAIAGVMFACGGGGGKSTTSPSPVTTTSSSTTTTVPAVPVLSFSPQTNSPVGRALALMPSSRGELPGMITVAVVAYNLPPFHKVRGDIRWNSELLEYESWGKGTLLDNDATDWTHYIKQGEVSLFLEYPSSLPARSGSGDLIVFRFKAKAGKTGTTQVLWNDPAIYTAGFSSISLNNTYGGSITIQLP